MRSAVLKAVGRATGTSRDARKTFGAHLISSEHEVECRGASGGDTAASSGHLFAQSSSAFVAQNMATTHPTTVHPRRKFSRIMAPASRRRQPMIDGSMYTAATPTMATTIPRTSAALALCSRYALGTF